MNKTRRFLSLLLTLVLTLSLCVIPAAAANTQARSDDPVVFVHGLMGWGQRDKINRIMPYWGMTTGSLTDYLSSQGYETYAASVGPISSAWDRACELYAQLVGARTDYGVKHSQDFGHDRYGIDYEQPLFDGWGTERAVNLVGHSFGGATTRLFLDILAHVERTAALALEAFLAYPGALLLVAFGSLGLGLGIYGEVAVLKLRLNIFLLESGQVDGHFEAVIMLLDVGAHQRGRRLRSRGERGVEERVERIGHQVIKEIPTSRHKHGHHCHLLITGGALFWESAEACCRGCSLAFEVGGNLVVPACSGLKPYGALPSLLLGVPSWFDYCYRLLVSTRQ